MKNLIQFILILLSSNVTAQSVSIGNDDLTKIIQGALYCVLSNEKAEANGSSNGDMGTINIWIDNFPSGFEPSQEIIDLDLKLRFISIHTLSKKQKKRGIDGIGFSGAIINKDTIQLYFNRKGVISDGKRLKMGIDGDGYSFEYRYSCEKQTWLLLELKR